MSFFREIDDETTKNTKWICKTLCLIIYDNLRKNYALCKKEIRSLSENLGSKLSLSSSTLRNTSNTTWVELA